MLHELTPERESPNLDIIAVHGLNGHYRNTWTDKPKSASATMWLQDLLPEKLPGSRVMSFQYDASTNNTSTQTVRDAAKKLINFLKDKREPPQYAGVPIVFVGHSLGGIVIKQTLATATYEYPDMIQYTKGIVFFGTPHRGSDLAQWGLLMQNATLWSQTSTFLKTLLKNSDDLFKIAEDFRPLANKYAIFSFYEEYTYGVLGRVVVDKSSAVMNLPHEETMMLNGTHTSMCRFSKDDPRFDPVWRRIQRAAQGP